MTDPHVRAHLLHVVATLRATGGPAPRRRLLDALEAYARAGRFPRPDGPVAPRARRRSPPRAFAGPGVRAPIFEDTAGTRCAVGHLLALDRPDLVARVRDADNGAYLPELDLPELDAWAAEHGLTRDELAWIQPSYCWEVPTCDEFVLEAPVAIAQQCVGPDASLNGFSTWHTGCQECDGPYRVYAWVQNAGTVAVCGVVVTLGAGDTLFDTVQDVSVSPGEVVPVELTVDSVTLLAGDGYIRVAAAEDCWGDHDRLVGWEQGNGGPGYVEPEECGGGCPDTGSPGETGRLDSGDAVDCCKEDADPGLSEVCGCGDGSAAGIVVGLGLALGARRRRTA
jgi:hypothetical protein